MGDIGKKGSIYVGGLRVAVKVLDVKISYGKPRWLVTPVEGADEVWVESVELT